MRWVDERGRLFGRVHLLDLALILLVGFMSITPLRFARSLAGLQDIELHSVKPTRLVVGQDRRIRIFGTGFSSQCVVKLSAVSLGHPAIVSSTHLEVDVPSDLPDGWYHPIVTGPRHESAAPMPILAVWKPEIFEITPINVPFATGGMLDIRGVRFKEDCELTIGSILIQKVQRLSNSHIRAQVEPGQIPPGPNRVRLRNLTGGEDCFAPRNLHIMGKEALPLGVVVHLDNLPEEHFKTLQLAHSGQKMGSPDIVKSLQILEHKKLDLDVDPAPPKPSFLQKLFSGKKQEKKKAGEKLVLYTAELNICITGSLEYKDGRYLFAFEDWPLEVGQPIYFWMNNLEFKGVVKSTPKVLSDRYIVTDQAAR